MRLISKKFSGVRKSKSSVAELVTTPTEGTTRMNEHAAVILGVDYDAVLSKAGSRIEIAELNGEGGSDEAVKAICLLSADDEGGSRLASPNKKRSGTLQFNGAASWTMLGGTAETNTTYSLDAEKNVVDVDEDGNYVSMAQAQEAGDIDADGNWAETKTYTEGEGDDAEEITLHEAGDAAAVWYLLELVGTEAKPVRKKKDDVEEKDDNKESDADANDVTEDVEDSEL